LSHLDFDAYTQARRFFSTNEWIDMLIQSMGFEPSQFSKRNKFNQLVRLIPFCERNYNLIELGPKGTGKSHIYSEFSPHGILISGGEVTTPKLFVHNGTGKVGLVGYWDTIAFDEFAGKKKRVDKALVDIMKNYMANKTFSRGIETLGAEASMVFVGNTQHSVPHMLKHSDLFDELPESYHDSAFLDRIHFYIAGWEVDIIRGEMFSQGYGFVVDYLAEVLRALRSHDYSDRYKPYFTLSSDLSTRDRDAINKTFSGLMKILYPDGQACESDIQELLNFAMEGRKRVKDQLLRIDNTYSQVSFSYRNQRDEIHHITTKEEDTYPNYYHKKTNISDTAISESYQDDALFAIPSTSIANDSATKTNDQVKEKSKLAEQQITWPEGATGFSLHDCITPYLQQATEITISDPNIGLIHQQDNLLELLTTIANAKSQTQQSNVQLIITTDLFIEEQQDSDLQHIAKACLDVGINLTWQFVPSTDITESFIQTNTGWRIRVHQGLDIYQPYSFNDKFNLMKRLPDYRVCKAFEMDIVSISAEQ
ncbi:MAG TPA: BREX system Lon protease-like protein BrxL, partial [Agitococcus sp.]|nr:BREX system Lon protease-like protein BrxL [Agitococcus sp.]